MRELSCALALAALTLMQTANAADLQSCRQISDPQQRLSCYDALALPAAAAVAAPAAAVVGTPRTMVAPATPTAADTAPRGPAGGDAFGLPARLLQPDMPFLESSLARDLDGWGPNQLIELANGQLWQVVDGSSGVLLPENRRIKVSRGSLGTYFMEFEGLKRSPRVKRVK